MKQKRIVISAKPPTVADWRWLDRQIIRHTDHELLALLCSVFRTTRSRILEAVAAVGPKLGDVRRYLQENPGKAGRPFRRRR